MRNQLRETGTTIVVGTVGVVVQISTALASLVVARSVDPATYGQVAYFFSLFGIVVLLGSMGLTTQVVTEVAQQIEPMVRKKGLEVTYRVADDGMVVHTDRTKLKQILLNLLSNAVKFTHVGWVRLDATRSDDFVRIAVADSGIGIKSEHLDAIWEDFRQIDQS